MGWSPPDKYHPGLKSIVREYVRKRREVYHLRLFWHWLVLEIFCDEIDRLEAEVIRLMAKAVAPLNFRLIEVGEVLHKVEPIYDSKKLEWEIVPYRVMYKRELHDKGGEVVLWVTHELPPAEGEHRGSHQASQGPSKKGRQER
jgi:hypothetical protein